MIHENFDDKIKSMKQELKSYGEDIMKHVSSLHSNMPDERISLKSDPKMMVQLLQQDVLNLIAQSEAHVENSVKNEAEIEECKKLMNILILVSTISDLIAQCDEVINGNDLLLTNKYLSMLQVNIDSLPSSSSDIGNGKICKLLRRENSILQSRFKSRLKRLLRNCVTVDVGKVAISKKLSGSIPDEEQVLSEPIELSTLWTALVQAGIADDCISVLVQEVWQRVLAPLWKIKKLSFPHVSRTESTCELAYDSFSKENFIGGTCVHL